MRMALPVAKRGSPTMPFVETDLELLERLRAGDQGAFSLLVGRYERPMLRFARSLVPSPSVAEEAVQDTWMAVVRGIDRFEGRSSFKTWLFRVLTNRARSAGLSEQRHVSPEGGRAVDRSRFDAGGQWAEPVEPWVDQSVERLDAAKWSGVLRDALETLPARQRQVVLLRDVEGLTSAEVCDVLGTSPGNARLLLHRGRNGLREALRPVMKRN
jgi:RNA polymerase sigma-70 factor, ECF subfamily